MTERKDESDRRVADIIHQRVGAGESGLVAGWQQMLTGLLEKMAPYLSAGRMVTFQTLLPEEKTFFEALYGSVSVPTHVTALYLPPSVRHQMMGGGPATKAGAQVSASRERSPDDGILLASRRNDYQTIVNVLFARPPHTPAIDVYEHGQLIAGYSYARFDACREEISTILHRHLKLLRKKDR